MSFLPCGCTNLLKFPSYPNLCLFATSGGMLKFKSRPCSWVSPASVPTSPALLHEPGSSEGLFQVFHHTLGWGCLYFYFNTSLLPGIYLPANRWSNFSWWLAAFKQRSCALVCEVLVGALQVCLVLGLGYWVLAQLISVGNSDSSEYFVTQVAQGGAVEFENLWQLPCLNPWKVPRELPYPTHLFSFGASDLFMYT